jgi:hypothetical protein
MFPMPRHNITYDQPNFYVSYNFADRATYGDVTTAVVVGQMQGFFILTGDHREGLVDKTFQECLEYLHTHADQQNSYSEPFPPLGTTVEEAIANDPLAKRMRARREAATHV